ncbi:MAG TPA: glycosyltransferase family 2 protein, partial [Roseiflexaceae bacterium]|nr:glycosyltransferase family 2 protein [Roseiflexaceae bacterium]
SEISLISLILVTYNSARLLPEFFAALGTTRDAAYEVLVVDNASSDGTPELVAERYPQAQLLANAENGGFGRACNQGGRAARGDLLVFLNPDVIVTPSWLAILARHMREHPDAAIICPTTLDSSDGRLEIGDWGPRAGQERTSQPPTVADTAAVPGCAMMIRRAAWDQLGGFDERFFLYWEDTELCWRAWLQGWRVLEDLEACVYHERGGSAGDRHWDQERTKNALRTYLKLIRWRRVLPFVALLSAKTAAKIVIRREPGLLAAWIWNWRHLGETLAWRRELTRACRGDRAELERLIAIHVRRGRRERRERRRGTRRQRKGAQEWQKHW